jgi:hypothetical protein
MKDKDAKAMKEEPAFPQHPSKEQFLQGGMTLRDYFAARAMAAAIQSEECMKYAREQAICHGRGDVPDNIAKMAYRYADAMMSAREGGV